MSELSIITRPNSINPEKIVNFLKEFFKKKGVELDIINTSIDVWDYYITKFLGVRMCESLKNKFQAFRTLLTSNLFFEQWHVFHNVANFLVDGLGMTDVLEPLEDYELMCTLHLARQKRPTEFFNEEVKTYIKITWIYQLGMLPSHELLKHYSIDIPMSPERLSIEEKYAKIKDRPDIEKVLNNAGFSPLEEIQLKKLYVIDKAIKEFDEFSIESTWM